MYVRIRSVLLALATAVVFSCGGAFAHEGHDHDDQPATIAPIAPRAFSVSDELELVAVARNGTLTLHLDRFATNEPVAGARIEAETPVGAAMAEEIEPGSYRLAARWSLKDGEYDVTLTVTVGDETEVFPVTLDIHGQEPAPAAPAKTSWWTSPAFAAGLRDRIGTGSGLIALGGFAAGLLAATILRRRRPKALPIVALLALAIPVMDARAHENHAAEGPAASRAGSRDQAQRLPDGNLFVPKPTQRLLAIRTLVSETGDHHTAMELPGRVIADPNGSGLVQSAQGGRLSAPPEGFPRLGARVKKGDVLAYATPPVQLVDSSDMLQKQGELDQQITIVERRVARFDVLAKSRIVSQVQAEEARAELRGLRDRRAQLDRIRTAPEPLVAPIDGIVAEVNAVAGQIAAPSAVVFQILDPARLLIEALSFEAPAAVATATARTADGRDMTLRHLGTGLSNRNQAAPVHFAIEGEAPGLRIGQFVTVTAGRADSRAGIAVPRASVVRGGNGQSIVFEKTGPEKFEPRDVRVEPLDGDRVIVAQGLEAGKRIVSSGAELLNQIR